MSACPAPTIAFLTAFGAYSATESPALAGASSLYSTPNDILRWLTWHLDRFSPNGARIALSERGRELASLRVLGFTRGEISYILLGELGVLIAAGIPAGFFLGKWMAIGISERLKSDLFRVPFVMEPSTYGFAAAVVVVSALLSGLLVRHRLDRLDLVAVLKTRE